jgi:hypothetical protein
MDTSLIHKSYNPLLPEPLAFSCWKHHLNFISQSVNELKAEITPSTIALICNGINGSVLDLYTGELSIATIALEVETIINGLGLSDLTSFQLWVYNHGKKFQQITLSDGSSWTCRLGRFQNRYIHIHPSRYSKNTLRVKPSTLKTAIAYCLLFPNVTNNPMIIDLNKARKLLLNLSPLKEDVVYHSIFRLVRYIHS